jgi:hypothetical protein
MNMNLSKPGKKENQIASLPGSGNNTHFFQPKLTVNQPNDKYEQEADSMADRVMRMANSTQNENTFFKSTPLIIQSKCQHCQEEEKLHRKESSGAEAQGSNELDSYVGSLGSSGQALPESSRQFYEPRFGQDFSNVRIHTDSVAAKSAQSINALAYTTGNNIVFNSGQYSPDSDGGKKLMAHELTHVVQQTLGIQQVQKKPLNKDDLIKKIKTLGIVDVQDSSSTFDEAELELVVKALEGLPATDKAAIKGAKIIRVSSLGGNTAGQYSNKQGYDETSVTDEQKIELSDLAFGSTTADESIRLITHEVGHAVAAMPHRVAMSKVDKEGLKSNELNQKTNEALDIFKPANDASNTAINDFNNALKALDNANEGTDKDAIAAAKKDLAAKRAIMDKLKADTAAKERIYNTKKSASDAQEKVLETKQAAADAKLANIDDLKTDAAAKLVSMETAFTAAGPVIAQNDAESADYRSSLTSSEDAIKKFYDENAIIDVDADTADKAKAVVDAAVKDRNDKRDALNKTNPQNTIVAGTTALETAQDSFYKAAAVLAFNKSMALSVKAFYDLVISKGISPALTQYAADNWPAKPEEFYAEAYSFFVTKPKELEAHSKDLYDWFKAGKYK